MYKMIGKIMMLSFFLANFVHAEDTAKIHTATNSEATCYNVIDYGAKGDGKTINTQAIQSVIDDCTKTGGTVVFPQGIFLSGTIFMKSNVTLCLMSGAVLRGSPNVANYPVTIPRYRSYTDNYVNRSLTAKTSIISA